MRLYVFVSHSFHDQHHLVDVVGFRNSVRRVVEQVESEMSKKHHEVLNISIYFEDAQYGKPLPAEIRKQIEISDFFVMDLAGASPNTFYELGYAHALGRQIILFEAGSEQHAPIPTDISDLLVGRYVELADLKDKLKQRLSEMVEEAMVKFRRSTQTPRHRCFWFDKYVKEIHVVCAPEPERTRFAEPKSPDYLYIDNLDDRDALFEVSTYLARAYPDAKILRHISSNLSPDVLDGNIVVLGGPNNNSLTRDLIQTLDVRFAYVKNDNAICFESESGKILIQSSKNSEGLLLKDVGYFGRFLNPFNRKNRIIMCHGCHTFGTLASCLLFSDNNQAIDNTKYINSLMGANPFEIDRIECVFEVAIMESRRIVHPKVQSNLVSMG